VDILRIKKLENTDELLSNSEQRSSFSEVKKNKQFFILKQRFFVDILTIKKLEKYR
jgi:hypothetical protein